MVTVAEIKKRNADWKAVAGKGGPTAADAASTALQGFAVAFGQLCENLDAIGYPKVPGQTKPDKGQARRLKQLEARLGGELPPALRAFWSAVGGASLVDLDGYQHAAFWRDQNLLAVGHCCDALHIEPCSKEWLEFVEQEFAEWSEYPPRGAVFRLSISPDGLHKDDISGDAPYAMAMGGDWLAPLLEFSWRGYAKPQSATRGSCDLLSYLRTALLECAGFPGLLGSKHFEPVRRRLLRGVPAF